MNAKSADLRFAPPSEEDARVIRAVIDVLSLFREESPTIPVSYVIAFLLVALEPGGGSTDYMGKLETIQPIMSRIMLALANKERRKALDESGFKLIDFAPDPLDLRRNRTFLTGKGKALIRKVINTIDKARK